MTTLDQPLGQLARTIPGATAVFHSHQLDFCCSGNMTLRDAAAQHNLDGAGLAAQLDQLRGTTTDNETWADATNIELIEHLLARYHDIHREQLPELVRLAQRVELVHGANPHCPSGLAHELTKLQNDLNLHMQKEEQILFPMITNGLQAMAVNPIRQMRVEHDDHADSLAAIDRVTNNISLPQGACNTWRALYLGLDALKTDLKDHIHLENNILFDRIDSQLGELQHG